MTRKYYNHTLQTNPRHHEEEPQIINRKKNIRKPINAPLPVSLPRQDYWKTRKDAKKCIPKQKQAMISRKYSALLVI